LITCEMCESQEVRYVHIMTHPNYKGQLEVGCVCAGNMGEGYAVASRREREFIKRQDRELLQRLGLTRKRKEPAPAAAQAKLDGEAMNARTRSEAIEVARSWIGGASRLLESGKLRPKEHEFIQDILRRATYCATARHIEWFKLSDKQVAWFRDIYL